MVDNNNNNNLNSKVFHLAYQEIVDALAQYLYDKELLDNEESEGSLVFELTENKGAKVIVTPSPKEDENNKPGYTVEHLDVDLEDKGDE